jgi:hypothetical protein
MQMLRFAQHDSTIFSHLLSPLGERVERVRRFHPAHAGRGPGEGVADFQESAAKDLLFEAEDV